MREGTGTRTARRDELLRLLIPTVTVPPVVVLRAELYIEHHPAVAAKRRPDGMQVSGQDEYVHVNGMLKLDFEHNGKDPVTLPAHGMRGQLEVDGTVYSMQVSQARELTNYGGSTNLTMAAPRDGVTFTGPRAVHFDIKIPDITVDHLREFEIAKSLAYRIELDVLHAPRSLRADVTLAREEDEVSSDLNPEYQLVIGRWSFGHPGLGS